MILEMDRAPQLLRELRAQTLKGNLFDAKELLYKLGWEEMPQAIWREIVHDQYRLAVEKGDTPWIRTARYFAGLRFPPSWVNEVMPVDHAMSLANTSAETAQQANFYEGKEIQRAIGGVGVGSQLRSVESDRLPRAFGDSEQGGHSWRDTFGQGQRNPSSENEPVNQNMSSVGRSKSNANILMPGKREDSMRVIPSNVVEKMGHNCPKEALVLDSVIENGSQQSTKMSLESPKPSASLIDAQNKSSQRPIKIEKGQKCPVQSCKRKSRSVRSHVQQLHLPHLFWDVPVSQFDRVHSQRLKALHRLAQWIIGDRDLEKLVFWANTNLKFPHNVLISPLVQNAMEHLCKLAGWKIPPKFYINPLNSPASLLHWRVICGLLDAVHPQTRKEFIADPVGPHDMGGALAASDPGWDDRSEMYADSRGRVSGLLMPENYERLEGIGIRPSVPLSLRETRRSTLVPQRFNVRDHADYSQMDYHASGMIPRDSFHDWEPP